MGSLYIILSSIFQGIMNFYLMTTICEYVKKDKFNRTSKIVFFVTVILACITSRLLKDINVILSIAILALIVLANFIFNYKIKVIKSIAIEIVTFLLFSITELIITFIILSITNLSAQDISLTPIYSLVFSLIQLIVIYLTTILVKYIVKNIKNFEYIIRNVTSKTLLLLLVILAICIVPQLIIFAISKYNYPSIFILINSIQIILVCIVVFITLKQTVEKDKAETDLVATRLHNETMSGMVDGLKTLKHDFNNIIQTLSGYSKAKEYKELDEYIDKLLKEFKVVNTLGTIDPEVFNEPGIYGIVGAKYFLITNDDITMDIEVFTNIKEINFPMPELARILGILLDNAYEATKKAKNPYVRLEMKYDNRKCADIIRVINTYDTNIKIDLEKIYKKGFSSKKVKSGIGLWEVKKLISKISNSQVYANIENDKFVQNIIIEK